MDCFCGNSVVVVCDTGWKKIDLFSLSYCLTKQANVLFWVYPGKKVVNLPCL